MKRALLDDGGSKRARHAVAAELRGLGGAADSVLAKLLDTLRNDPAILQNAPTERRQFRREGLEDFEMYGRHAIIPTTQKPYSFKWHHADAGKLLKFVCERSPQFLGVFETTVRRAGATPLDVIVYYDEITPGNILRPDNARRMHAIYFSFRQFPQEFLRCSDAWLPIGVLRSKIVKHFPAQFSTALREIVSATICESSFADGVVIHIDGAPRMFTAVLTNNLADGLALKTGLECKGAAGVQPCVSCKNVINKSYAKGLRDGGYVVSLDCADYSRLDLRTANIQHYNMIVL